MEGVNNKRRKTCYSPSSSSSNILPKFPSTHCRCGAGYCKIKQSSKQLRWFYSCPNVNEMCCGYFKWCDELKEHEILRVRPPPFPRCSCGAGVCRLETERTGPHSGRKYFACKVKKGHGACKFRQWQDLYYEIANIRQDFENGDIDPDFPYPTEQSRCEKEINDSDETFSPKNIINPSPFLSPTSPLDAEVLASLESEDDGWWW